MAAIVAVTVCVVVRHNRQVADVRINVAHLRGSAAVEQVRKCLGGGRVPVVCVVPFFLLRGAFTDIYIFGTGTA